MPDAYLCGACTLEAEALGGLTAYIQYAPLDERATVVDAHNDLLAIAHIRHLDFLSELDRAMGRSHFGWVGHFAGRCSRRQLIPGRRSAMAFVSCVAYILQYHQEQGGREKAYAG